MDGLIALVGIVARERKRATQMKYSFQRVLVGNVFIFINNVEYWEVTN